MKIRNEIYDANGLVKVEFIEVDEPTTEELLSEKQNELLKIYKEIQDLQKIISNT